MTNDLGVGIRSIVIYRADIMTVSGKLTDCTPCLYASEEHPKTQGPVNSGDDLRDRILITRIYWIATHNDLRRISRVKALVDYIADRVKLRGAALFSPYGS